MPWWFWSILAWVVGLTIMFEPWAWVANVSIILAMCCMIGLATVLLSLEKSRNKFAAAAVAQAGIWCSSLDKDEASIASYRNEYNAASCGKGRIWRILVGCFSFTVVCIIVFWVFVAYCIKPFDVLCAKIKASRKKRKK